MDEFIKYIGRVKAGIKVKVNLVIAKFISFFGYYNKKKESVKKKQIVYLFKKGKQLQDKQEWEKAIVVYRKIIHKNNCSIEGYFSLAECYINLKQHILAIDCYRRSIVFLDENSEDIKQAILLYKKSLKICDRVEPYQYYKFAKLLESKSFLSEAIEAYIEALKISYEFIPAYYALQYITILPDRLQQLAQLYSDILKYNPNIAIVWGNLGDILSRQGKEDLAIPFYRKSCYLNAIENNPELAKLNWKEKKEDFPDFIIIGSAKCGTTSLYKYLSYHPQVLFSYKKELRFFLRNYNKGKEWYLAHFPTITDTQGFITGEATPAYLRFPIVAKRIKQNCPNTKLIVLLRNPVDRSISWHYHKASRGLIKESLSLAISQEIKELGNCTGNDLIKFNYRHHDSILASLYYYQIKAWMAEIPRENFLILQSEEFYSSPAKIMESVFSFLGIDNYKLDEYKKCNAGSYNSLDRDVRKTLKKYFAPHNQKLEDYLDMKFNWN